MSGISDDLATLREDLTYWGGRAVESNGTEHGRARVKGQFDASLAALARVEAELGRLTARRSRYAEGRYTACMEELSAAEARCARLQQALEAIAQDDDLVHANEDAFSIHAYRRCVAQARKALAGPDTPADSHYRERPIEEDFYLDPRGEWVYRWSDERRVLKPADSQEETT